MRNRIYTRIFSLWSSVGIPPKSARCLRERGFDFDFDFAFAATIFRGPSVERDDLRKDYGERRRLAIGRTNGLTLAVVFTDRRTADDTPVRHIISARLSSRRERKAYAQAYPELHV